MITDFISLTYAMSQDAQEIEAIRKSLKVEQRASLVQIIDETLQVLKSIEKRLRTIEKMYEEND